MANDGSLVFSAEIDTQQLNRQIAELEKITINLDGTVDMTKVKKTVESTTFSKVELDVAADVSGAEKDVAALKPDDIEIKVDADTTGADEAFDELEKKSGKLKSFFTDGLKSAGEKLLPDDAFELISDLVKGVTDVAKAGDEVDKSSQKMGISRQSYQEWGYVLERNGASTKDLQSGLKSLNGVVSKAESGNREAIKQFSKLGIEFKDISKMSREDIFETVITGLQGIDDEGEKAALATAMFGDSATELLPLLNQTAEETTALKKEAQDLGTVMGDDAVNSSVAFNDSLGKMRSAWEGLTTQLATVAMPLFTGLFNGVNNVFNGVFKLFGGTRKTELNEEIQGAITDLETPETKINTAREKYNDEALTITVNYEESESLLTRLAGYQQKDPIDLTEDDLADMREISTSLVSMYQGLEKYMGADGIIHKEAGEVLTLIGAYSDLERQRSLSNYISALETANSENTQYLAILKSTIENETKLLDEAKNKNEDFNTSVGTLYALLNTDFKWGFLQGPEGLIVTDDAIETLNYFAKTFPEVFSQVNDAKYTDLLSDGLAKSADEINSMAGGARLLRDLILDAYNASSATTLYRDSVSEHENNIKTAKEELEKYGKEFGYASAQYEAAKEKFQQDWNVDYDDLKKLLAEGMSLDDALVKLGATSQGVVDDLNGVSKAGQEAAESGEKIYGIGNKTADAIDELRENASKTGAMTGEVLDAAGNLQATALTVEQLAANIQVAQEAGATAQADLAARKETVVADAQAILTSMNDLIAALALDVDTMVTTMNTIVTNGEVGAATAGNAFAQGAGDGYRANTALRDAVGASAQQSLAALNSYANAFETAGSGLVGSIASGVTGNASALSDAVRDAVRGALAAAQSAFSGNSVFRTASRYYPHRTGLEYVPYDEYPALLHKGESVLTASEAALWRGGLYVREPGAARVDYDALAAAIWRGAPPEGGLAISVNLNGEEVANVLEPSISALQGRRLALQRR